MGLLNITSFLPELSLLALLIITALLRFFEIKKKYKYSYSFISVIILTVILTIQQFFYYPHFYLSGTLAYDSFGTVLKIFAVSGLFLSLLILYDKKIFADSKSIIYYSVMLFSVFISVSSNNLLLTYCSFELLTFSYFTVIKVSSRSKAGEIKLSAVYTSWLISSALMIFSISLFYGMFGSLNYSHICEYILKYPVNPLIFTISILLLFSGFAFKLYILPLQLVVLDMYKILGLNKLSIILITATISAGGAFIRFVKMIFKGNDWSNYISSSGSIFNWEIFIVIIFSLIILTSAIILYLQKEYIPAVLYIILINIPFIFISVLITHEAGMAYNLLVIFYIIISIIGILTAASNLSIKLKSSSITDFKGAYKFYPVYFTAFFILLASLSGFPPTLGFSARLLLFSSINASYFKLILIVSVFSSFIILIIFFRMITIALSETEINHKSAKSDKSQISLILIIVILILLFGFFPQPLLNIFKQINIISV